MNNSLSGSIPSELAKLTQLEVCILTNAQAANHPLPPDYPPDTNHFTYSPDLQYYSRCGLDLLIPSPPPPSPPVPPPPPWPPAPPAPPPPPSWLMWIDIEVSEAAADIEGNDVATNLAAFLGLPLPDVGIPAWPSGQLSPDVGQDYGRPTDGLNSTWIWLIVRTVDSESAVAAADKIKTTDLTALSSALGLTILVAPSITWEVGPPPALPPSPPPPPSLPPSAPPPPPPLAPPPWSMWVEIVASEAAEDVERNAVAVNLAVFLGLPLPDVRTESVRQGSSVITLSVRTASSAVAVAAAEQIEMVSLTALSSALDLTILVAPTIKFLVVPSPPPPPSPSRPPPPPSAPPTLLSSVPQSKGYSPGTTTASIAGGAVLLVTLAAVFVCWRSRKQVRLLKAGMEMTELETLASAARRKFDVFISHFTHDDSHDIFNAVHAYLSAKNISVFNPTTHLSHVKEVNTEAMQGAVKRSKLVVAALSDGFFESSWCAAEIAAAKEAGIRVIPVYSGDDHAAKQIDKWVDKYKSHPEFGYIFNENARDVLNKQNPESTKRTLNYLTKLVRGVPSTEGV